MAPIDVAKDGVMADIGEANAGVGASGAVAASTLQSTSDEARSMIADATRTLGGVSYIDTNDLAAAARAKGSAELTQSIERQLTPTQRGEFARESDRLTNGPQWGVNQILGTNGDFIQNYNDMREANTIGADKYFHCKANFDAAARGPWGAARAAAISDAREFVDQHVKGDPASASDADQVANRAGRELGTLHPSMMAREACDSFRPNGLDARY